MGSKHNKYSSNNSSCSITSSNTNDLNNIQNLSELIHQIKGLVGLNITIPYKETIIPHLDKLSKTAQIIGAVNCVTVSKKKKQLKRKN
jgi:shikimate 5-dehydrogenase